MAKQTINIGTQANDRTGDPLRAAFTKINENFTEVYDKTINRLVAPSFTEDPVFAGGPTPGQLYYNTVTGKFRGYNAAAGQWEDLN
jgi:hypothetical protein